MESDIYKVKEKGNENDEKNMKILLLFRVCFFKINKNNKITKKMRYGDVRLRLNDLDATRHAVEVDGGALEGEGERVVLKQFMRHNILVRKRRRKLVRLRKQLRVRANA